MADMRIEMTPSCGKCGSNVLSVPDDATDMSIVTGNACGAENGTKGELVAACQRLAAQKFEEEAQATFGQAFEGLDGVKFTKPIN
jgi:hypothetical protein